MHCDRSIQEAQRLPRCVFGTVKPAKRRHGFDTIAAGTAGLLLLCLMAGWGCSADKRQVEQVALQFVEGVKNGDAQTLEKIMDWERWYSVHSPGGAPEAGGRDSGHKGQEPEDVPRKAQRPPAKDEGMSDHFVEQKNMLLSVLSTDRVLALRYLTAEHVVRQVSVKGPEALVQILQEDRATGEKRLLTLQLHRDTEAGWRIYKFLSEDLEKT